MNQGGNYWTLFTPGIWKVLHAVFHSDEAGEDSLEEPEDILEAMRTHLARALAEVDALAGEVGASELAEAAE